MNFDAVYSVKKEFEKGGKKLPFFFAKKCKIILQI